MGFLEELGRIGQAMHQAGREIQATNDPKYLTALSGATTPSDVRSYEYWNKLTPDQQAQFLALKRAQQTLDLGGQQVVLTPSGEVKTVYTKTLPPSELPETKAAQTTAQETAKIGAAQTGKAEEKAASAESTLNLISEVEKVLPKASSGGLESGLTRSKEFLGISSGQSEADAKLAILGAQLTQNVPRMEGPQSDKDTLMYKAAAGQVDNSKLPKETRIKALNKLKELTLKYSTGKTGNLPVPKGNKPMVKDEDMQGWSAKRVK